MPWSPVLLHNCVVCPAAIALASRRPWDKTFCEGHVTKSSANLSRPLSLCLTFWAIAIPVSEDTALFHPRPAQKSLMLGLIFCCYHLEMFNHFWTKRSCRPTWCPISYVAAPVSISLEKLGQQGGLRAFTQQARETRLHKWVEGQWDFVQGNVQEHSPQRTLCHPVCCHWIVWVLRGRL